MKKLYLDDTKLKRSLKMLTAIAILLLSAVGGGMVGVFLTNSYPHDAICEECTEKALYQDEVIYDRMKSDLENKITSQEDNQLDSQ